MKMNKIKKSIDKVFKDLGVSDSNEQFIKACFTAIIRNVIIERGLGGDKAVETLGISRKNTKKGN